MTTERLFRREALEARREDWLGSVHLTATRLAWPMAMLSVAAVIVAASILAFGSYTPKVAVSGRLVPAEAAPHPADGRLRAELWVPDEAIGRIAPGGRVAIRYHAFPYQRYGLRFGRIARIGAVVLAPPQMPIHGAGPVYPVWVDLDTQEAPKAGTRLHAGMGLDADLLLERRPLYRLVFGRNDRGGETR